MRLRVAVIGTLVGMCSVSWMLGCRDDSKAARPSASFVGSASCKPCHEKEAELWAGSHHDLAMQPASAESVLGNFDNVEVTAQGVTSRFFRKDDKFCVRTDGPDGVLADYEVRYAFGVEPLQQYLIEFPGGRLQTLPLAWDSRPKPAGGQRWFHVYPNERIDHEDVLHWTRAGQNWNLMCAECHSTNLRKRFDAAANRYDTSWSELDVSCEACHGPGSRHVAWARQPEASRGDDDGLTVRLKTSDLDAWFFQSGQTTAARKVPLQSNTQVETCARCHARRGPLTEDYEHGKPLMDTHSPALLEEGLYHADGQILDEVYVYGSFLQSKMYHKGVTCTSCHEPHGLGLLAKGNALCTRCHDAESYDAKTHHFHTPGKPGAGCVDCHMPETTYMVVDPRRDHSFKVPRPDLSVELGTPNACTGCHEDKKASWAAAKVVEWFGPKRQRGSTFARALHAGRRRAAGAPRLLRDLVRNAEEPGIVRATALELLAGWLDRPTLDVALTGLTSDDPLLRRAAVRVLGNLPLRERAVVLGGTLRDPIRGVRIEAARVLAAASVEQLGANHAPLAPAVAEYVKAETIHSDRPQAHVNLANLHLEKGEAAAAEAACRRALRVEPRFVPARVNLVQMLQQKNRDAEGEKILREGLQLLPKSAELQHVLGLLLHRRGRGGEALTALARAAALAADNPRYAYVYGVALKDYGKVADGLVVLERAHWRHTGDADLVRALAMIHKDQGNRAKALQFAQKLLALVPEDRAVRSLVDELKKAR